MSRSAFTLIELLIVIAIVAALSVVVVLAINPAELLRQSRDVDRLSDMDVVSKAISLYTTDVGGSLGLSSTIYLSIPDPQATSTAGDQCQGLGLSSSSVGWAYHCSGNSTYKNVDGTGWVPINFSQQSFGSSLSSLPVDPTNTTSSGLFYAYTPGGGAYAVTATLESQKYLTKAQNDGGYDPARYETGTNLIFVARSEGLMGWWTFDEGIGSTAKDSSGNGNAGTLGGTPVWQLGSSCKGGNCLSFVQSYVQIPNAGNFSAGSGHTIMAWFKPNALSVGTNIFLSFGVPYLSFHASGVNSFHSASIGGIQQSVQGSQTISTGNWYHVVGAYDNNRLMVYLNGVLDGSTPFSGADSIGSTLCVGAHNCSSYWTNGIIDNVRVYSRALSAVEIQNIYNAEK